MCDKLADMSAPRTANAAVSWLSNGLARTASFGFRCVGPIAGVETANARSFNSEAAGTVSSGSPPEERGVIGAVPEATPTEKSVYVRLWNTPKFALKEEVMAALTKRGNNGLGPADVKTIVDDKLSLTGW